MPLVGTSGIDRRRRSECSVFFRLVLLAVIVGIVAAWYDGYRWGGSGSSRGADVKVSGSSLETGARRAGAEIAGKVAEGANLAEKALQDARLTTKIKSKMALDDTIDASQINVDTAGTVVTIRVIRGVGRATPAGSAARARDQGRDRGREQDRNQGSLTNKSSRRTYRVVSPPARKERSDEAWCARSRAVAVHGHAGYGCRRRRQVVRKPYDAERRRSGRLHVQGRWSDAHRHDHRAGRHGRADQDGKVDGSNISFVVSLDFGGMPLELSYKGVVSSAEIKMTIDFMGMPFDVLS